MEVQTYFSHRALTNHLLRCSASLLLSLIDLFSRCPATSPSSYQHHLHYVYNLFLICFHFPAASQQFATACHSFHRFFDDLWAFDPLFSVIHQPHHFRLPPAEFSSRFILYPEPFYLLPPSSIVLVVHQILISSGYSRYSLTHF